MRLLIVNVNLDATTMTGCDAIAECLEDLQPTSTIRQVHWPEQAAARTIARWTPDAVILGPNGTPFPGYPDTFQSFLTWVRSYEGPLLGICGGHQVLALAHGAEVGPVSDVPAATHSYEGMPKITGMTRVVLEDRAHPIFSGLPGAISVAASHVDEVKDVPKDFRAIATGDPCAIQAIAHTARPQLGVQFHPERQSTSDHGTRMLENWLHSLDGAT